MNEVILKCDNVCKSFGKKQILKNITFEVNNGDIFGFIGPNGAGKTTLIKVMLGLQNIDSGNVFIDNFDIKDNFCDAIRCVGAIVEEPNFYGYLSGKENLKLKARLYNVSDERINEVVNIVKLSDRIDEKVSKYSLGMKQRLGIANAILNNPKLLILDEPTNGLDPDGMRDLRETLLSLSNSGVTIFISSHILKELDNFCNKICIIKNGLIVESTDMNTLKNSSNESCYLMEVDSLSNVNLLFKHEVVDDNKIKFWANKEFVPIIVESLVSCNVKVYSITEVVTSLEDIFMSKVGDNND